MFQVNIIEDVKDFYIFKVDWSPKFSSATLKNGDTKMEIFDNQVT